jgi:hypothetical protein
MEIPVSRPFFYASLEAPPQKRSGKTKSHLSLEVPSKGTPSMIAQEGPYVERFSVYTANGLFIHSYLSEYPLKEFSQETEGRHTVTAHGALSRWNTYNEVWPGSPRGSFTTLQLLPQCHAGFSTIPFTSAWVDQSPVRQGVSQ